MDIRVSGKNIDIGESLRTHILGTLQSIVEKYYEGFVMGHVTVTHEGFGYKTEIVLHLSSGVDFQGEGLAAEVYAAVDDGLQKVEKRLRRYKRRLKSHHVSTPPKEAFARSYVLQAPQSSPVNDDEDFDHGSDFQPIVIAEVEKPVRTMTVGDAVLECDMTGASHVMFRNAGTNEINLVYKRPDGHIGWIDPSVSEKKVATAR